MLCERKQLLIDWVRGALSDHGVELTDVIADASTRSFVRIQASTGSYIVMDAVGQAPMIEQFVEIDHRLARAGVNVPELYSVNLNDGFVLMTDLGKQTYLSALSTASADVFYKAAINTLVTMQRFTDDAGLPVYDRAFLMREMRLFPEWFLGHYLGLELEAATLDRLERSFRRLCDNATGQPMVFVHRDFHSRNLMPDDGGNPGVLDFQDAVRGPHCYDLVSLLRDVYIEWPEALVEDWLDYYRSKATALTAGAGCDSFRRAFDLAGLQRHLKIAGLFVRLHARDGKSGYLAHLPLTLSYINKVCERYPELDELSAVLDELDVYAAAEERALGVASVRP